MSFVRSCSHCGVREVRQPGERLDRAKSVTFTFDGKPVTALGGDPIGSALYAAGRHTFSRSFKYPVTAA